MILCLYFNETNLYMRNRSMLYFWMFPKFRRNRSFLAVSLKFLRSLITPNSKLGTHRIMKGHHFLFSSCFIWYASYGFLQVIWRNKGQSLFLKPVLCCEGFCSIVCCVIIERMGQLRMWSSELEGLLFPRKLSRTKNNLFLESMYIEN